LINLCYQTNVQTLGFSKWVIVKPMVKVSGDPNKTHGVGFGWTI